MLVGSIRRSCGKAPWYSAIASAAKLCAHGFDSGRRAATGTSSTEPSPYLFQDGPGIGAQSPTHGSWRRSSAASERSHQERGRDRRGCGQGPHHSLQPVPVRGGGRGAGSQGACPGDSAAYDRDKAPAPVEVIDKGPALGHRAAGQGGARRRPQLGDHPGQPSRSRQGPFGPGHGQVAIPNGGAVAAA